jgi:multidrug efflux pump subunit AcrA (membrane-fusion protein)
MKVRGLVAVAALLVCAGPLHAQREHTRLSPRGTTVSKSQASELTLTLTQVAVRDVQTWVRTAGSIDSTKKIITAYLTGLDAEIVKPGQRARAFPVESRFSMYQSRVARVVPENGRVRVDVELVAPARPNTTSYVVEIVTQRGDLLSVPNEAIIEEGTSQVVYVQRGEGEYEPQEIKTGIQGELYTQILDGVKEGDQVVTFGSFFIDSEYKLKRSTGVAK